MPFRYSLVGGVMLTAAGIACAQAQSPFPPAGQSAFPSGNQTVIPGGGFGGQQPMQQQQQVPPCVAKFIPLREEMENRLTVVKATLAKKPANPAEACAQLTKLNQSQQALVKFLQQNANPTTCPFPPELLANLKNSQANAQEVRKQACAAAAGPPRGAEPTLSDALSPPPVTKETTKTGGGTLDSLFGNPIAR